jgi:hypothetical protein
MDYSLLLGIHYLDRDAAVRPVAEVWKEKVNPEETKPKEIEVPFEYNTNRGQTDTLLELVCQHLLLIMVASIQRQKTMNRIMSYTFWESWIFFKNIPL